MVIRCPRGGFLHFWRAMVQQFGSADFFLLGLIGVSMVGIVSSGALVKGLLAGAFRLGIALIGTDPVLGLPRATFGYEFLYDGISLIPMIVGLFAVPEMLNLVVSDSPVAKERLDLMLGEVNSGRRAGHSFSLCSCSQWLPAAICSTCSGRPGA